MDDEVLNSGDEAIDRIHGDRQIYKFSCRHLSLRHLSLILRIMCSKALLDSIHDLIQQKKQINRALKSATNELPRLPPPSEQNMIKIRYCDTIDDISDYCCDDFIITILSDPSNVFDGHFEISGKEFKKMGQRLDCYVHFEYNYQYDDIRDEFDSDSFFMIRRGHYFLVTCDGEYLTVSEFFGKGRNVRIYYHNQCIKTFVRHWSAVRIQRALRNWMWKPYYSNGRPGFHARKGLEACNIVV